MTASDLINLHTIMLDMLKTATTSTEIRLDNKLFVRFSVEDSSIHVYRADMAGVNSIVIDMKVGVPPALITRNIPNSNVTERSFCACKFYNKNFLFPDGSYLELTGVPIDDDVYFQMSTIYDKYEYYVLANYIHSFPEDTFMYMNDISGNDFLYITERLLNVKDKIH